MVAGFQAEQPSSCGLQGKMVLHFAGDKGLRAQGQRTGPFIAASTGANGYPRNAACLPHGANHRVQRVGHMGGKLLCVHGNGKVASAQIAFAGDVCQAQAMGQHIVDAAGGAVQVGVGAEHVQAVVGQRKNETSFVRSAQHLLDGGKHDGVMGNDQVSANGQGFLDNGRRYVHSHENTVDFSGRVAHQHTGIVKGHLRVVGSDGIDEVINILHGQHRDSSNRD